MERPGTGFRCGRQPATGSCGMVVTNHPLASAAGAALFALTVVEPMMVGLLGGGLARAGVRFSL